MPAQWSGHFCFLGQMAWLPRGWRPLVVEAGEGVEDLGRLGADAEVGVGFGEGDGAVFGDDKGGG